MIRYALEIMMPGSGYDLARKLESHSPFPAIQRGDVINQGNWPPDLEWATTKISAGRENGAVLQVVGVEHFLSPDSPITRIFTEAVENVFASRISAPK